jgi:4-aminobutyrate aminotransferase-like enzyme
LETVGIGQWSVKHLKKLEEQHDEICGLRGGGDWVECDCGARQQQRQSNDN